MKKKLFYLFVFVLNLNNKNKKKNGLSIATPVYLYGLWDDWKWKNVSRETDFAGLYGSMLKINPCIMN